MVHASRRPRPAPWFALVALALVAPFWAPPGCTPPDRVFASDGGEGGADGDGGAEADGGADGDGGTDGNGLGGASGGATNGGSGGASGGAPSGGAPSGGGGTGGQTEPQTISCAGMEYTAPDVEGDWACQTFDDVWPPEAPWTLSDPLGDLEILQDLFVSSPSSMRLAVPSSGSPDAKLAWSNTAGGDVTEIRLELEVLHNTLPAAPPAWDDPLSIACLDFGQTEGCLLYQWGNGGYSLRITNYQTIPESDDCDVAGSLTGGSWDHLSLTFDNAGDLVLEIEGQAPVTCSRGAAVTGTVASVWVGMEGASGDRQGYYPRMDDVLTIVTRE